MIRLRREFVTHASNDDREAARGRRHSVSHPLRRCNKDMQRDLT
jgi:hypothetical protein